MRLQAVGDMMFGDSHVHIGNGVCSVCRKNGCDFPFSKVRDWFKAQDALFFGNLEYAVKSRKMAINSLPYIVDSEDRARIKEFERLLGQKTMELKFEKIATAILKAQ